MPIDSLRLKHDGAFGRRLRFQPGLMPSVPDYRTITAKAPLLHLS